MTDDMREKIERIEHIATAHKECDIFDAKCSFDLHLQLADMTGADLLAIIALAKRADELERQLGIAFNGFNEIMKYDCCGKPHAHTAMCCDNTSAALPCDHAVARKTLAALNAKEPTT